MNSILILGIPTEEFIKNLITTHGEIKIRHIAGNQFKSARELFASEIFQWALKEKPLVVTYSAGWQGSKLLMSELMSHLTGRSSESIQYYLFDMGVEVKSHSFTGGLLSIKDLMLALNQDNLNDQQKLRFKILGELIR